VAGHETDMPRAAGAGPSGRDTTIRPMSEQVVANRGAVRPNRSNTVWSAARALRLAVPVVSAIIGVEAALSVIAGWPHQFNGHGDPHQVLAEFPGHGTALAPPLFILVPLVIVALAVQLSGGWRVVAALLLVPLAAILAIGAAGEAFAAATPDVPQAVQLVGGGLNILLAVAMLVTAVLTIVAAIRSRGKINSAA
jgi:hypothetical protein